MKLSSVGFESAEGTYVQSVVELASGLDISQWEYVAEGNCDVLLVNSDTLELHKAMQSYQPSLSNDDCRPLLVSCSNAGVFDAAAAENLSRPISYTALVGLLNKIQSNLRLGVYKQAQTAADDGSIDETESPDDSNDTQEFSAESLYTNQNHPESFNKPHQNQDDYTLDEGVEDMIVEFQEAAAASDTAASTSAWFAAAVATQRRGILRQVQQRKSCRQR